MPPSASFSMRRKCENDFGTFIAAGSSIALFEQRMAQRANSIRRSEPGLRVGLRCSITGGVGRSHTQPELDAGVGRCDAIILYISVPEGCAKFFVVTAV